MRQVALRWRANSLSVTVVLVIIGFAMGVIGFRQMYPSSSWIDRIYSSLQLLVLAGPNGFGVDSLPPLLSWGRFVAAAGLAGTVLTFFVRVGTQGVDRQRAKRAKGHVVVIGTTAEARAVALSRATSGESRRSKVFLVGEFDDVTIEGLRSEGIIVVRFTVVGGLSDVIDGAREIVIAEGDDGAADSWVRWIQDELSAPSVRRSTIVRVLVRQTDLARTMRAEFATADRNLVVTALSVVEAASQQLTSLEWFPAVPAGLDTHLLFVGSGDLIHEAAISAVERRSGRSQRTIVDLWSTAGDQWCADVRRRVGGGDVDVNTYFWSGGAVQLAVAVEERCVDDRFVHQLFLIGLDDGQAITMGRHLARYAPHVRVVLVQQKWRTPVEGASEARGSLRFTTLGDLLSQPEIWDIDEQLGRELLLALGALAELPGVDGRLPHLKALLSRPASARDEWARGVASSMRTALAEVGFSVEPTEEASAAPVLMSPVLIAMRDRLQHHLSAPTDRNDAETDTMVLLSVLQDLPELLRRCGYTLVDTMPSRTTRRLSPDVIDRLAQRTHESYLDLAEAMNNLGSPARGASWDELSPDQKESNRAQVRDLPIKLLRLGYRVVPADTPGSFVPDLSPEVIDQMAWFEHLRWMHSRVINGWRYGATRDDARRLHPLIVAYEDLPEQQWEFDRGPIRLLPELLRLAGLAVAPLAA